MSTWEYKFFSTKKLVPKFLVGVQKKVSVAFHVQRSNCLIGCFGDNH